MFAADGGQIYRRPRARQARRRRRRDLAALDGHPPPRPGPTCSTCLVQHVRAVPRRADRRAAVRLRRRILVFYLVCAARRLARRASRSAARPLGRRVGGDLRAVRDPPDRDPDAPSRRSIGRRANFVGQLGTLLVINIVFGIVAAGYIDNFAHVGGLRDRRAARRRVRAGQGRRRSARCGRRARAASSAGGFIGSPIGRVAALLVLVGVMAVAAVDRRSAAGADASTIAGRELAHRRLTGRTTLTRAPRGRRFSAIAAPPWARASSRTIDEPEPAARAGPGRIAAVEALERAGGAAGREARAVVDDGERDRRARRRRPTPSTRRASSRIVPARTDARPARCRRGCRGSDRGRAGRRRGPGPPSAVGRRCRPWPRPRGPRPPRRAAPRTARPSPRGPSPASIGSRCSVRVPARSRSIAPSSPTSRSRRPVSSAIAAAARSAAGAGRRPVGERRRVAADHRQRRPEVVAQVGEQLALAGARPGQLGGQRR